MKRKRKKPFPLDLLSLGCNGLVPCQMEKMNLSKTEQMCKEIETWVKKKKKLRQIDFCHHWVPGSTH